LVFASRYGVGAFVNPLALLLLVVVLVLFLGPYRGRRGRV
jgi:hypothetical protein